MQERAFRIAEKWLLTNRFVYVSSHGNMWEKYMVNGIPDSGRGGEYEVQSGFGWSNGVVLDFLVTYADRMSLAVDQNNTQPIQNNEVVAAPQVISYTDVNNALLNNPLENGGSTTHQNYFYFFIVSALYRLCLHLF